METEQSWNQKKFKCTAGISFWANELKRVPLFNVGDLRTPLQQAALDVPTWYAVDEQSERHEAILGVVDWRLSKHMITFDLELFPRDHRCKLFFGEIQPGQLRAFCAYVDSIAQILAGAKLENVGLVVSNVHFNPQTQHTVPR